MNSVLNPEAQEFYPHLTSVTKDGYTKITKTIKLSNHLPAGATYNIFKTFSDFDIVSCKVSNNVVKQTNDILIKEVPPVQLNEKNIEYNTEKIIDATDNILDRVNINIDNVCRVNAPCEQFLEGLNPNCQAWSNKPVITKIQLGSTMFIGAKNITRPQLTFKDPIDNTKSLWVPKISDKPNNIKPLALTILFNEDGDAVGYEHPYKTELDLYEPPVECIEPDPEPPLFPPPLEETSYTYVQTEDQVNELVVHLETVYELAIDVEHHSYRTYQGITCLIQISTYAGDFIIDTLAVRDHIHKLNLSFTDPKKLKVFHGAEMDIVWLQRDFGVYVVGMFDTHKAARALRMRACSLKNLLAQYCSIEADKKYQLADWRIRPLPDELVKYARMDTHYLLYIWRCMKGELLAVAAGQPHLLLSVFEKSRQLCGITYNKEVVDDNSHMAIYTRSKKSFNSKQMSALRLLYAWRDAKARELDESTSYLLPNHMLLAISETLPREMQGLTACCNPMSPFLRQNLGTVHKMVLSCREMPLEPNLFKVPSAVDTTATVPPVLTYEVLDLGHFPEHKEDTINLDQASAHLEKEPANSPDIPVFKKPYPGTGSRLNVDAKMFVPPYDRYKQYRSLAQAEEIKEFKDKEAKITAISKGNEYIKTEVLIKLQKAKTVIENEKKKAEKQLEEEAVGTSDGEGTSAAAMRRRKMYNQKAGKKKGACAKEVKEKSDKTKNKNQNKVKDKTEQDDASAPKPFNYKNMNYRKFCDDSEKAHKQTKMKYKKHK